MDKRLLLIALLVNCFASLKAQAPDKPAELFPLIKKSKPDTNRIALLNQLGGYYIFKPGNFKYDLDSAFNYLNQALQLSQDLNSSKWINATLKLKGDCYLEGNDIQDGTACFKFVVNYYHKKGDLKSECETWVRFGDCIPIHFVYKKVDCYAQALVLAEKIPKLNREWKIGILKNLADAHLNAGKLDLAEAELKQVLTEYKAIGYKQLEYTYDLLGELYRLKGFPNFELFNVLQCIKSMKISGDSSLASYFYSKVGIVYEQLGFDNQSIYYFNLALSHEHNDVLDMHSVVLWYEGKSMIRQGKGEEALNLVLKDYNRLSSKDSSVTRFNLEEDLGYCYQSLKKYPEAERHYLNFYKARVNHKTSYTQESNIKANLLLSELYTDMSQYDKAKIYLHEIGLKSIASESLDDSRRTELQYFKVDSAQGRLKSAIIHFEHYKALNDSIFNDKKNKLLQELEISYETAEKESSIASLQYREKGQRAELKKVNTQRNLTLIGILLISIIAGLAYNAFRQKRRNNALLQVHQKEMHQKNESLQQLNYNQQLLLIEKEWLLREIHHRVKNNLQTTISLLNMQSAYLSNDEALAAIRNSQRRMQAMSLIHQKLYQSETMTHVQMADYITELVAYLKESFHGSREINFVLHIEPIMLEVTQAIPLGLIINEAVTNAIKYAFPENEKGNISISLKKNIESLFDLVIADNGVGMPRDFELNDQHDSLGLNLIRGLTDQINGELNIINKNGTSLRMTFRESGVVSEEEFKSFIKEH